MNRPPVYLTAAWINLINITWKVNPDLLVPHLPAGTELETEGGKAFVSLVPFRFDQVRLRGWRIPFHTSFPEMNLRFYVNSGDRRGVVFIREFVPRFFVAWIARNTYNEPYVCIPMKEKTSITGNRIHIRHDMRIAGQHYFAEATGNAQSYIPSPDSPEHRFKELPFGFGRQKNGQTLVYEVEHPVWEVYPVLDWKTNLDYAKIYGSQWSVLGKQDPELVAMIKGSPIVVREFQNLRS